MEKALENVDQSAVDFTAIEERLHRLESRDWSLWVTAVVILLLFSFAIFAFAALWSPLAADEHTGIGMGGNGLVAVVILFALFALYQQYLIKRLRKQLHEQLSLLLGLRSEADILHRLAAVDPLTDLFNRRMAMRRLKAEINMASHNDRPLTVLVFDLDRFKEINDTYGHQAGDLALLEFARRLQKAVRNSDTVARYGGDEFLVVLPDCTREHAMLAIVRMYNIHIEVEGTRIPVGFSYGMATYEPGDSTESLFARADEALYAMKRDAPGREADLLGEAAPPPRTVLPA